VSHLGTVGRSRSGGELGAAHGHSDAGTEIQCWRGTDLHPYRAVRAAWSDLGGIATAPDASHPGDVSAATRVWARINGAWWVNPRATAA
jgi:hypothetical protein